MLDHQLWSQSGHNPVKQLRDIGPDKLRTAARDQCFVDCYESVMSAFDAYMGASDKWFHANYPRHLDGPVAYFSMEFAIHNSLPIYAGGLGVLAGGYCREASDLGIPMVAVGFLYLQGYFPPESDSRRVAARRVQASGVQRDAHRARTLSRWTEAPGPGVAEG